MDWAAHMRRILARLGEDAALRPANGAAAITVRGVYAAPYAELLVGVGPGIASSSPRFGAMLADIPDVLRGDRLDLAAGTHRIVEVQRDAPSGLVILQLELRS